MASRRKYKPSDRETVIDMALSRNKISNSMVAKRLKVDEKTIRNWRKEYPAFDEAFTEAHRQLAEKINNTARKSLDVRKRRTVTKETEDGKIITEDVLPSHNDLAAFAKLGLRETFSDPEAEKRDDLRRTIIHKFVDGEYTALQATLLLETEGLDVPHTLKLELEAQKTRGGGDGDKPEVVIKLVNSPDAE
ncbi:transposase [Enterobacter sp. Lyrl_3]|uniref:transposase n=1 Tax=Enterobacter sp. Lyrl_3 TaxID=3110922 RepID=UPI003F7E50A8